MPTSERRVPGTTLAADAGWSAAGIERITGSSALYGNRISLKTSGPDAFDAWRNAVEDAREFIYLEAYCVRADTTGKRLRTLLRRKAEEGVAVFVIHDWLGCWATPRSYWRPLREAGVRIHCFNPPRPSLGNPLAVFQRDHRKLMAIDGKTAFVGGFGIGDEWIIGKKGPPWRDTGVTMEGPLARATQVAFESMWGAATGDRLVAGKVRPGEGKARRKRAAARREARPDGQGALELFGDEPRPAASAASTTWDEAAAGIPAWLIEGEPGRARVYQASQLAALRARKRIWITDAYFVAPRVIAEALGAAAEQGVDVRILVPAHNNWPIVGSMSRSGYRDLLESGIRLFEWKGPMIHAKTAVVDDIWCRVGSSNLNAASLLANWEIDVTCLDARLAGEMCELFLRDLAHAVEIVLPGQTPLAGRRSLEPTSGLMNRLAELDGDKGRSRRRKGALASAVRAGGALRDTLSGNRTLEREDRTVLGVVSTLMVAVAVLAAIFPRLAGWTLALVAGWFGISNAVRAFVESRRARVASVADDTVETERPSADEFPTGITPSVQLKDQRNRGDHGRS